MLSPKGMFNNVNNSIAYNSSKMEATQMSINKSMDKYIADESEHWILYNSKNEPITFIRSFQYNV